VRRCCIYIQLQNLAHYNLDDYDNNRKDVMRMQILLIHGFMLNRDVRKRILKNFDDLKK